MALLSLPQRSRRLNKPLPFAGGAGCAPELPGSSAPVLLMSHTYRVRLPGGPVCPDVQKPPRQSHRAVDTEARDEPRHRTPAHACPCAISARCPQHGAPPSPAGRPSPPALRLWTLPGRRAGNSHTRLIAASLCPEGPQPPRSRYSPFGPTFSAQSPSHLFWTLPPP